MVAHVPPSGIHGLLVPQAETIDMVIRANVAHPDRERREDDACAPPVVVLVPQQQLAVESVLEVLRQDGHADFRVVQEGDLDRTGRGESALILRHRRRGLERSSGPIQGEITGDRRHPCRGNVDQARPPVECLWEFGLSLGDGRDEQPRTQHQHTCTTAPRHLGAHHGTGLPEAA